MCIHSRPDRITVFISVRGCPSKLRKSWRRCRSINTNTPPFIKYRNLTVTQAAHASLLNTGQNCIAAKRFIVVRELAEKLTKLLLKASKKKYYYNSDEQVPISTLFLRFVLSISSSVTNSTCCSLTRTENHSWLIWTRFLRINKGSIITIYNSCFSSLLRSW